MSTLPQFERALVQASRALHAEATAGATRAHRPRRRRLIRRVRRLNLALQLGLAVSTVSALAGGGAFAYLALSPDTTRTLGSLECSQTPKSAAIIDTITGDPVLDCAIAWPSASAGRSAAPPLVAWGSDNGTMAAIVQPARWPAPASSGGVGWHRLRPGWTVNLGVVAITDQLSDIASGLSASGGARACVSVDRETRMVRALLDADSLQSWRVVDRGSGGCAIVDPIITGAARTVTLVAARPQRGGPAAASPSPALRAAITANAGLLALDRSINRTLGRRCTSVAGAAALWTRRAGRAGLRPATLTYWRALNATARPSQRLANGYYTLVSQPAAQRTGSCAHILVLRAGGGATTVYAARIAAPAGL